LSFSTRTLRTYLILQLIFHCQSNMKTYPKLLKVETGWLDQTHKYFPTDEFLDYRVYANVPKWWRWIEQLLRTDFYLAIKAKQIADQYDIIWANSEKVALPLSFMNIRKPLVVILQYPESPFRVLVVKVFGLAKRWAGVGIVSKEARLFLQSNFGLDSNRIFQYYAARTDVFQPSEDHQVADGPILSMGVAKRDYDTLIGALTDLPGYHTEIFVNSRYGDKYRGQKLKKIPAWIDFPNRISDRELVFRYQACKFVVIPLNLTSHSGAGVTSAFEASASGKAVIATNTGGMSSYVIHGKTGILVPPKDVHAMRDAIKMLWENEALAAEMGQAGRKFVEENYQYESVVAGITLFLSDLWNRGRKVQGNVIS
jgi:glycosyltransferase involved in cell wall biosynthesis